MQLLGRVILLSKSMDQLDKGSWEEHIEFKQSSNQQWYQPMTLRGSSFRRWSTQFSLQWRHQPGAIVGGFCERGCFAAMDGFYKAPNVSILQRPANCKGGFCMCLFLLEFCRVYCCMCWKDSKTGPEIQSATKIPGALQLPLGPGGCLSFISAALTYLPNRKTKTWLWAVQLQGCQELFGQRQG